MPRRLLVLLVMSLALVALPAPAAQAKPLRLSNVAGLPANAARDLAVGPSREVWMTSDAVGSFVARISAKGKLLSTVAVPGTPDSIVRGPDGAMWFTLRDGNAVGRVTRAGAVTTFPVPVPAALPRGIAAGADGALWVTLFGASAVARLTTAGVWTVFTSGLTPGGEQLGITRGPGGIWFTEPRADRIAKITPSGAVTGFTVSNVSGPEDVAVGIDGNLWFTEDDGDRIGRLKPTGGVREFQSGITPGATPFNIGPGPDEAMWFTETDGDRVGRSTPDGFITEYGLPKSSFPRAIITGPDGRLRVALAGTGRVVRFTPPLAPVVPASISSLFSGTGAVGQLLVEGIPAGGRVEVLCRGNGCPLRRYVKRRARRVNLRPRIPRVGAGSRLQIRVAAPGYATRVRVFTVSSTGIKVAKRCIAPGTKKLRKGCG